MESLGDFLLEEREENEDEMETGIKTTYIGDFGEIFAFKYLKNLFDKNNIRNYKIKPHKFSQDDYDIEIYTNDRTYKIEVKTSTAENHPVFHHIQFRNNFDFLLLIWKPSDNKIYFSILTKNEARKIVTPENTNMEEDDDYEIQTTEIFDENNREFLNRLSRFLELDKELEDLEDEEKIELVEDAKEEIMKNPNAVKNDFSGETYQEWIYEYLSNFTNDVEIKPKGDECDIKYKGKGIEVKYSSLHEGETSKYFKFNEIKPNLFDFIFLIGFDDEENKFYFSILTRDEILEIKRELAGDEFYSKNGFRLNVGKHSKINFVNDFTFEDFDNYIETH